MRCNLILTFLSDWHVGSGLGDGCLADSILVRDGRSLLYLPGRAIKGALREGAHRLGLAREDLAEWEEIIFGAWTSGAGLNRPGRLTVGNGRLPGDLERILLDAPAAERSDYVRDLTILRRQTAITKDGTAASGSLRTLECGIPGLYFQAELNIDADGLADEHWLRQYLLAVCGLVKSLGGHRSRGLGRCRCRPDFAREGTIITPPPLITRV